MTKVALSERSHRSELFSQRYADIVRWTPRSIARRVAISSASMLMHATGGIRHALKRPRVHFLYLHHVFEDEEAGFRRILEEVARSHSFIDYSEAVTRVRRGQIDRPYVTFSFDDGLKSCLRAGEILNEYDARACFFVCPTMPEEKDLGRIEKFCREQLDMPPTEFLSWADMEQLVSWNHEIGSHTMSHRRLSELDSEALEYELGRSREELSARFGNVRHLAWPFGRFFHMKRIAADAVFRVGYESCASAERGAHVSASGDSFSALCIRRDQLIAAWPLSHTRFFLARSSNRASAESNNWPDDLDPNGE